jgi:vacuolar-type H+-ATPase subunit E/Vma4
MPIFQENVYQYFQKEIEESGNKKIQELKDEIKSIREKQMDILNEEISDTITRTKEIELNEMNQEYSSTLNRLIVDNHKEIIKKKNDLLESVLFEVRTKLLQFVETDKYKQKMIFLVKKIDKDFCGDEINFKVKNNDKIMKKIIDENFKNKHVVIEDKNINIGGFIAICVEKGILTDQLIDSSLEEKKQWFYKNSKLAIKK